MNYITKKRSFIATAIENELQEEDRELGYKDEELYVPISKRLCNFLIINNK